MIAGHVDSRTGPAVFARLRDLRGGDRILVEDREGRRSVFRVVASEQYAKDAFPTERVYTATPRAVLRLITCSGSFDRAGGHYVSNLVVFASAVRRRPAVRAAVRGRAAPRSAGPPQGAQGDRAGGAGGTRGERHHRAEVAPRDGEDVRAAGRRRR